MSLTEDLNNELEKIYNSTNFNNKNINQELTILHDKFLKNVISLLKNLS